jgi:hypothetical protein
MADDCLGVRQMLGGDGERLGCLRERVAGRCDALDWLPVTVVDRRRWSGDADGDVEVFAARAGEAFKCFDSWCAGTVFPCGDG